MKKALILLCISLVLSAEDVIVERMQSVVDEVTQLRKQYETVQKQHRECQESLSLKSLPQGGNEELKKRLDTLHKENEKLRDQNAQLQTAHESFKKLQKKREQTENEIEKLAKENQRLNSSAQLLIEKNHTLQNQIKKLKNTPHAPVVEKPAPAEASKKAEQKLLSVQHEKDSLAKELLVWEQKYAQLMKEHEKLSMQVSEVKAPVQTDYKADTASTTRSAKCPQCKCPDDNLFPKLIMKDEKIPEPKANKEVNVQVSEQKTEPVVHEKGTTYRVKGESPVYNDPQGGIVEIWEDRTSFTSNITWGGWVKITGFFIDKKWKKAQRSLWIHKDYIQTH